VSDLVEIPDSELKRLSSKILLATCKAFVQRYSSAAAPYTSQKSPGLSFLPTLLQIHRTSKTRKLRSDRGGEVAKLFARHIKLEEHTTI
jgi:hypothetical protein